MADATCSVSFCDKPVQTRGWCIKHYAQIITRGEIVDQSDRRCGWCDLSIAHLSTRAAYCSVTHKKNAAAKRHRERNPGYYKRYTNHPTRIAYREANREVLAVKARERRQTWTPERLEREIAANKLWWSQNAERHRLYQAQRRSRKVDNPGSVGVPQRDWQRLVRRYNGCCAYCGVKCDPHMDHVVPLKRGGRHAIGNVLPACGPCNLSKSARLLADWKWRR